MRKFTFTSLIFLTLNLLLTVSCGDQIRKLAGNPPKYKGPQDEFELDWSMDHYGSQVARARGLKMLAAGYHIDKKRVPYSLSFRCEKPMTLDEGRKLAADMVEDFWEMLKNDPTQHKYVRKRRYEEKNFPDGLTVDKISLKICFMDKNKNRFKEPYLAEILFLDGNFQYFEPVEDAKKPKLCFKESYASGLEFRDNG